MNDCIYVSVKLCANACKNVDLYVLMCVWIYVGKYVRVNE